MRKSTAASGLGFAILSDCLEPRVIHQHLVPLAISPLSVVLEALSFTPESDIRAANTITTTRLHKETVSSDSIKNEEKAAFFHEVKLSSSNGLRLLVRIP